MTTKNMAAQLAVGQPRLGSRAQEPHSIHELSARLWAFVGGQGVWGPCRILSLLSGSSWRDSWTLPYLTVMVQIKMSSSKSWAFECLVPSRWPCLGRVQWSILARGSMSQVDSEICPLCFVLDVQDVSSPLCAPTETPATCCYVVPTAMDSNLLDP